MMKFGPIGVEDLLVDQVDLNRHRVAKLREDVASNEADHASLLEDIARVETAIVEYEAALETLRR